MWLTWAPNHRLYPVVLLMWTSHRPSPSPHTPCTQCPATRETKLHQWIVFIRSHCKLVHSPSIDKSLYAIIIIVIIAAVCSSVGQMQHSWPSELITNVGGWGFDSRLGRWIFSTNMWYRLVGRLSGGFSGYSGLLPLPQIPSKYICIPNSVIAQLVPCTKWL